MSDRAFEAPDLIEVMDEAVRYNGFLTDQLLAWSAGMNMILDVGAGSGRFARALKQAGRCVEAVEPDKNLREQIQQAGLVAHAYLSNAGTERFDGAYSINVLEHVEDDAGMLRSMGNALKPGGGLFLYVPAFEMLFSANDKRVGHLRRYRKEHLVQSVRRCGFSVSSAFYVDSIGFLAALWYRYFGDQSGWLAPRAVRIYDRWVFPVSRVIDRATGRAFGKNLLVIARKTAGDHGHLSDSLRGRGG